MKKSIISLVASFLLFTNLVLSNQTGNIQKPEEEKVLNILTSPETHQLINFWTIEYAKLNPGIKFNLIESTADDFSRIVNSEKCFGIFSDTDIKSLQDKSLSAIVVGRDVVVPVINSNNPLIDKINIMGLSSDKLARIFKDSENISWGTLIGDEVGFPVNCYLTTDESVNSKVAAFLKLDLHNIKGIEVLDHNDLIGKIQSDPYAIGFIRLTDIIEKENIELSDNVKILPIDKNGNSQIDHFENIYSSLNDFTRGVWIGKYPRSLVENINAALKGFSNTETEVAFINWVLTDGQSVLSSLGMVELAYGERQSKLEKINSLVIDAKATEDQYANSNVLLIILILIIGTIIAVLVTSFIIRKRAEKKETLISRSYLHPKVIYEDSLIVPDGVYFDKTHTWVFMEKDGVVKIGLDDFISHVTGPLTRVKLKNPGDKVKKSEPIISLVQNGKQLNIYSPISGRVKDINERIITSPYLINSSPFNEGWVYMIEPSNWLREMNFLIMSGKYKEWIKGQFTQLKDFLAVRVNVNSFENSVILQEGGELTDHVLSNLDPKVWEDFQTDFIDAHK